MGASEATRWRKFENPPTRNRQITASANMLPEMPTSTSTIRKTTHFHGARLWTNKNCAREATNDTQLPMQKVNKILNGSEVLVPTIRRKIHTAKATRIRMPCSRRTPVPRYSEPQSSQAAVVLPSETPPDSVASVVHRSWTTLVQSGGIPRKKKTHPRRGAFHCSESCVERKSKRRPRLEAAALPSPSAPLRGVWRGLRRVAGASHRAPARRPAVQ